jgi:DNA-binding transcriptional ArsR family regulator
VVNIVGVSRAVAGEADIARVGALLAEPARARVLLALADGRTLAASALAAEARVAPSTASHHLSRLVDAGLITVETRGRHRYFTLAGREVAELVEAAARVAPLEPISSLRQGTRAHAIRYARRCYDHLAGRLGVALTDALLARQVLVSSGDEPRGSAAGYTVTRDGADQLVELGVHACEGEFARGCRDWTEQRNHIAGPLGRALMMRMLDLRWLTPDDATRAVRTTPSGRENLTARLGVTLP